MATLDTWQLNAAQSVELQNEFDLEPVSILSRLWSKTDGSSHGNVTSAHQQPQQKTGQLLR